MASGEGRQSSRKVFQSVEEAKSNGIPIGDDGQPLRQRLYCVSRNGQVVGFCYGNSTETAVATAARNDGYTAEIAESSRGEVTKEKVAEKLAEFTDEELKSLGLSRLQTRQPKPEEGGEPETPPV